MSSSGKNLVKVNFKSKILKIGPKWEPLKFTKSRYNVYKCLKHIQPFKRNLLSNLMIHQWSSLCVCYALRSFGHFMKESCSCLSLLQFSHTSRQSWTGLCLFAKFHVISSSSKCPFPFSYRAKTCMLIQDYL